MRALAAAVLQVSGMVFLCICAAMVLAGAQEQKPEDERDQLRQVISKLQAENNQLKAAQSREALETSIAGARHVMEPICKEHDGKWAWLTESKGQFAVMGCVGK